MSTASSSAESQAARTDLADLKTVLENQAAGECEGFCMDYADDFPTADITYTVETAIEPGFYVATLTIVRRIPIDAMPVIRTEAERIREDHRRYG